MNEKMGEMIYRAAALIRREKTFRYLREYERTTWRSLEDTEAWQKKQLASLVRYAVENIPFYRELGAADFGDLPLVSKAMLKEEPHRFVHRCQGDRVTVKVTSGSTSEPLRLLKDNEAMAREQAATYRSYAWAGVKPGARQARFWGTPLKVGERVTGEWRDRLLNRTRYSAFRYDDRTFEMYTEGIRRQRATYIYGYASLIHEFARFLTATGNHKNTFSDLKAVITTAEILTPRMREDIASAFGVGVFDEYGCAETGSIAHDCERGKLHINSENLLVEVLDDSGAIGLEGEGRLVLTDLHNRVQPLLRYDSGDYGVLSRTPCECGRPLLLLENVHGRAYDTVIGPKGVRYNAAFFSYLFKEVQLQGETIRQFQVIQEDRTITFRIVKGKDYSPAVEESLAGQLRAEFGDYFVAHFEYCENVEREKSGKLRQLKRISPPDPIE